MMVAVMVLAAPQNITYARVSVHVSPGKQRAIVQMAGQTENASSFICPSAKQIKSCLVVIKVPSC